MTMAAGLAAMRLLTPDAYGRLADLGDKLRASLDDCFKQAGLPGRVTGLGSLFRLHPMDRALSDYRSTRATPAEAERLVRLVRRLMEHGVLMSVTGLGCLSTPMGDSELDLVARAGARICACPTTEANLGDGFLPVERVCTRGIGICIGSDSNVRIDPLEELRELEGIARRQTGRRGVISTETLLCFGADEGGGSVGLEEWEDVEVDLSHPSLRGVEDVFEGLVSGCGADVFASGGAATSSTRSA